MKTISLRVLFVCVTCFCVGLTTGIAVSNSWSVSVSFGKDNIPVYEAASIPAPSLTYFSQIIDSDGEVSTWTNEPGPLPPFPFPFPASPSAYVSPTIDPDRATEEYPAIIWQDDNGKHRVIWPELPAPVHPRKEI